MITISKNRKERLIPEWWDKEKRGFSRWQIKEIVKCADVIREIKNSGRF